MEEQNNPMFKFRTPAKTIFFLKIKLHVPIYFQTNIV